MPGQKFGPAWFPGLIAAGLAICGALLVLKSARHRAASVELPGWLHSRGARNGVAALLAGLLAYILVADRVGFHVTGIVLVTLWVRVLGASSRTAVLVGIIGTVAIHLAFYKLLRVPLPWGVLERWAF
jgi:putative tricarboxylic transport membrane protein